MESKAVETEKEVIGMLANSPVDALRRAQKQGLRVEWFTDDTCAVYYLGLLRLADEGKITEADPAMVYQETRTFAESQEIQKKYTPRVELQWLLDAMSSGVTTAHLEYHLATMRSAWMVRAVRRANLHFTKQVSEGLDVQSCIIEFSGRLSEILKGSVTEQKKSLARVMAGIMEEYRTAYEERVVKKNLYWTPGFRWPWSAMTNLMNGLEAGLGIIAARPSVGKTLFALNLMRFWCDNGVRVVFNSLDMADRPMIRRFIAERSRVSIKKAKYTPTKRNIEAMEAAVKEIEGWPLSFVEIRDVDAFAGYVQVEQADGGAQIVIVDYLGLMQSARVDNANEYARVSYVSDRLKELANTLQIPVIALCQLNREVAKAETGRMPSLSDLRGSGSIEQDAYWVAFLHRDQVVTAKWAQVPPLALVPDDSQYDATVKALDAVHFVVAKSQNGECGALPFVFRRNYLACQLADYTAQATTTTTGYGATARTVVDNSPRFARVCSDWRHDPMEADLRRKGTLIEARDYITVAPERNEPVETSQGDIFGG